MNFVKRKAFTLVELLVVIGIIAILIAILLPVLSSVRQQAISMKCLANLRTCGQAMMMYVDEHKGWMPFPSTNLDTNSGSEYVWFGVIDPYLSSIPNTTRSTVAGSRAYSEYKQCPLVNNLFNLANGSTDGGTGAQNTTTEATRSYKMNAFIKRNDLVHPTNTYAQVKFSKVPNVSNFVWLFDGISMDTVGYTPSIGESTANLGDPDGASNAGATLSSTPPPMLRHRGACNVLFVDSHAETVKLATHAGAKPLSNPNTNGFTVTTWQSEFINSSTGAEIFLAGSHYPIGTALPANMARNPMMPLQWSDIPNLTR